MFHDTSARTASILAAWFAAFLNGMLLIVSLGYIRLVTARGVITRTDKIMISIVLAQFLLAGSHNALCLQQLIHGFLTAPDAEIYFADQGSPSHVAQTALYLVNNWIADGILVWRLYIVFNKNKRICIPYVVLIFGAMVTSIGDMQALARSDDLPELFKTNIGGWMGTYCGLTIITQLTASCLIACRIWTSQRKTAHLRAGRTSKTTSVLWIILESGVLLSCTTIVLLGFYFSHKKVGNTVATILGQLSALVPASILLRVTLNKVSFAATAGSAPPTIVGFQQDGSNSMTSSGTMIEPVVHVHRSVDIQNDHELYDLKVGKELTEA